MLLRHALTAALLAASALPALASGACENCWERDRRPAYYGNEQRPALIRPGAHWREVVPGHVRTVRERVVVAPAQVVRQAVPAHVAVVREQVVVAPARREWRRVVDITGREVLCEVEVPAEFATQARTVAVPAQVRDVVLPARTAVVARRVATPPRVVERSIPAEVHTLPRPVEVIAARDRFVDATPWAPRRAAW